MKVSRLAIGLQYCSSICAQGINSNCPTVTVTTLTSNYKCFHSESGKLKPVAPPPSPIFQYCTHDREWPGDELESGSKLASAYQDS